MGGWGFCRGLGESDREGTCQNLPSYAKGSWLQAPGSADDVQGLFVTRPAFARVPAEALEVLGDDPAPDAEVEAPAAQNIEHGKILGFTQRILKRQEADRRSQA